MDAPEGWSIQENHLMREFSFDNFAEAKRSSTLLATSVNNKITMLTSTSAGDTWLSNYDHDKGKVTSLDIDVAKAINALE